MFDATAFGQWNTAWRLIERGARSGLWESAALGLLDRVEACFAGGSALSAEEVTGSFWGACHGGQKATAEHLLGRGAELDWVGWDNLTPLDAAERSDATEVTTWLRTLGARSATENPDSPGSSAD